MPIKLNNVKHIIYFRRFSITAVEPYRYCRSLYFRVYSQITEKQKYIFFYLTHAIFIYSSYNNQKVHELINSVLLYLSVNYFYIFIIVQETFV